MTEKDRELLLKMIVRCKKARRPKVPKVQQAEIKLGGTLSSDFADQEIQPTSYYGPPSLGVRKALTGILAGMLGN